MKRSVKKSNHVKWDSQEGYLTDTIVEIHSCGFLITRDIPPGKKRGLAVRNKE